MSRQYFITLIPLKPFFFGGDQTFGAAEYVARSRRFPQQTQLLGALRLYLGEVNGLMWVHRNGQYVPKGQRNRAYRILGGTPAVRYASEDDIGQIIDLSPMFITDEHGSDVWMPTPFDYLNGTPNPFVLRSAGNAAYLDGYNPKKELVQRLGGRAFWQAYIRGEAITSAMTIPWEHEESPSEDGNDFRTNWKKKRDSEAALFPHRQIGIELERKQVVQERFYLKYDYNLNTLYRLGFFLTLDESVRIEDGILRLGADGSLFALSVQEVPDTLKSHPLYLPLTSPLSSGQTWKADEKCVVLSPMMFSAGSADIAARYTLIPSLHHEAILQSVSHDKQGETHSYERFGGKTEPIPMIPSGAVIHPSDETRIPQPRGVFAKIGYNRILTIPTKESTHV